jgi:hypothetical protein
MNLFPFSSIRFTRRAAALLLALSLGCAALRADVVFAWNELLLHVSAHSAGPISPLIEARAFAMVHLAMYDAVEQASTNTSPGGSRIAEQRAAVVSAARVVLLHILPSGEAAIEALAARHLGAIPEGDAKARGIAIGEGAAHRIVAHRQDDRWNELIRFHPPMGPVPDTSETAAENAARGRDATSPWLKAVPFGLKSAGQFHAIELREYRRSGEVVPGRFLHEARLFKRVDADQAVASREDWASSRPVVMWNRIARQVSAVKGVDVVGQAALLAALNVALADAMLATLHSRHTVGSWRSFVIDRWIGGAASESFDGTVVADPTQFDFQRILIPPLLNYPAFTPTLAGAAESALRNFFGADEIVFSLPLVDGPGSVSSASRTFPSISAAALEYAYVTSLNGELREACFAGYALGAKVGGYVAKKRLRSRR